MESKLQTFVQENDSRILAVVNQIKDFKNGVIPIRALNAKERIVGWLENFEALGFDDYELPLILLENIEFFRSEAILNGIIQIAEKYINKAYLTHLGEETESSYRLTAPLNKVNNFYPSLHELLDHIPEKQDNRILFIDDFLNSGGQICSIFYAMLDKAKEYPAGEIADEITNRFKLEPRHIDRLTKAEINLVYFFAFSEGVQKIQELLINNLQLKINVESFYASTTHENLFGTDATIQNIVLGIPGNVDSSSVFKTLSYERVKPFYHLLKQVGYALVKINQPKWKDEVCNSRTLGYGNLARLIVTDMNVPTITLTALWCSGVITVNGIQMEWRDFLPRTKKIVRPKKRNVSISQEELDVIDAELQTIYEDDLFPEGLLKSEEYYATYGALPKILKHLLRFNIRTKNTIRVSEISNEVTEHNASDIQKRLCYFAVVECMLGASTDDRHRETKFDFILQEIQKFLLLVPASQTKTSRHSYLQGRMLLEKWWAHRSSKAYLYEALQSFNTSIARSDDWWVHCYKCIALKLSGDAEFDVKAAEFLSTMREILMDAPKRHVFRLYYATALILREDRKTLIDYLELIKDDSTLTGLEDALIHRIELIFANDKEKQLAYTDIIEEWMNTVSKKQQK